MKAFWGVFACVPGFELFPVFRNCPETRVSMAASKVTHSASGTHVIAGARQLLGADEERKTQGSWQKRKPFAVEPGVGFDWNRSDHA